MASEVTALGVADAIGGTETKHAAAIPTNPAAALNNDLTACPLASTVPDRISTVQENQTALKPSPATIPPTTSARPMVSAFDSIAIVDIGISGTSHELDASQHQCTVLLQEALTVLRPSPLLPRNHGSGPGSSQTHLVPSGPDVWSFHSVSKWLRRRPRTRHHCDALKGPTAFALDENSSPDQDERRYDQHGQRNQAQIVAKD